MRYRGPVSTVLNLSPFRGPYPYTRLGPRGGGEDFVSITGTVNRKIQYCDCLFINLILVVTKCVMVVEGFLFLFMRLARLTHAATTRSNVTNFSCNKRSLYPFQRFPRQLIVWVSDLTSDKCQSPRTISQPHYFRYPSVVSRTIRPFSNKY